MKRELWLTAVLFIIISLLAVGCSEPVTAPLDNGYPRGLKSPRVLTEAEEEKVLEISLKTPEALAQLEKFSHYDAKLNWNAIVWRDSEISEWRSLDYDWENDPNTRLVTAGSEYYAALVLNFGEPPQWQVYVAVNPDTGKVVTVMENPFRTGPTLESAE